MRKTVSITIAQQLFNIEEQGYVTLDAYLTAVRAHFASYEDRDEIVADIEARIAEHFQEKLSRAKNVISESDVDDLIAQMGTVKDFEEFEGEAHAEEPGEKPKFSSSNRLYRDSENQMIAGVAAGIANYFGIDPTIVRLIFAVTLLFGGAGILIYIVLWIVVPEARTTSEKVEMRGQQLTLKRIEATIRENIPAAKEKLKPGTLRTIIQFPFMILRRVLNFLGRVIRFVAPIIVRIIGCAMLVGISIGIFALTFALFMLLSNAWDAYMDVPVRELAGNTVYYTGVISAYLAIILPATLIILLATSMMLMKNQFRFPFVVSLIGVWVAVLLVGSVTVARELPALQANIERYIETHDTAVTKELDIDAFTSLEVHSNYNVRIKQGPALTATITGTQRAVDELTLDTKDDLLKIGRKNKNHFCILCLGNGATIDVTVPGALENLASVGGASITVDGVDVTGASVTATGGADIKITNAAMAQTVRAEANGGASIDLTPINSLQTLIIETAAGSRFTFKGMAQAVTVDIAAGSNADLSGSGTTLRGEVVAGSSLRAEKFTVQDATLAVAAGGDANVYVTGILSGEVSSGGSIYYTGDPASIDVERGPAGRVEEMGERGEGEY